MTEVKTLFTDTNYTEVLCLFCNFQRYSHYVTAIVGSENWKRSLAIDFIFYFTRFSFTPLALPIIFRRFDILVYLHCRFLCVINLCLTLVIRSEDVSDNVVHRRLQRVIRGILFMEIGVCTRGKGEKFAYRTMMSIYPHDSCVVDLNHITACLRYRHSRVI